MDNLTHSLVGALIGQTGLKRRTGLAMPALIIGANIPDIDATCTLLGDMQHLALRRGITHGPPAMLLLPLLLAGGLWWFDRWQTGRGQGRFGRPDGRLPVRFGWLYALSLIACLSHPALDWLNTYGIRLLEPFSSRWFHGDTLFIIDVWLWLGMGVATWLSLRREKRGGAWRQPARIGLAAVLAYIGMNAAITRNAERSVRAAPTGLANVVADPQPLNPFARPVITGGNGLYAIDGEALPGIPLDRCDLARARRAVPAAHNFLFWSRLPFIEPREDGTLWLRDARFASELVGDRFMVRLPADTCPMGRGEEPAAR